MKDELHIYLRVSTEIQQSDGFGLDNQKELGLKVSEKLGLKPIFVNEGSQSSSKDDLTNRPKLRQLLEDCKVGKINNVWCFRVDRLSRNEMVSVMIRKIFVENNVTLFVNEGSKYELDDPQNQFMLKIFESVSQFEQQMRTDRLRRGRFSSVQRGGWKGGPPPYGYRLEDKQLVVDEEESKWVKLMYEEFSRGRSVYQINSSLVRNGVLGRRGKLFNEGSISLILKNTIYGEGYYIYKDKNLKEQTKVETPIIIDDLKVLSKVRDKIKKQKEKRILNNFKKESLLTHFLVCGHCNSPFGQRINPKQYHNHYYCRGNEICKRDPNFPKDKKLCVIPKGRVRRLNITDTDKLVWDTIVSSIKESNIFKEVFKQKTMTPLFKNNKYTVKEKNEIKRKIKGIQTEVDKIESYITDNYVEQLLSEGDKDKYDQIIKRLEERKTQHLIDIEELKKDLSRDTKRGEWVDWVKKFSKYIDDLDQLKPIQRKEFLTKLIDKITVFTIDDQNQKINIRFKTPMIKDDLIWKDQKNKDKGYEIISGKTDLVIDVEKKDYRLKENGGTNHFEKRGQKKTTIS